MHFSQNLTAITLTKSTIPAVFQNGPRSGVGRVFGGGGLASLGKNCASLHGSLFRLLKIKSVTDTFWQITGHFREGVFLLAALQR